MSKEPKNQTAYAAYLYAKIDAWFALGRGGFTIKQMAEFSGLKPTGNFRRRINHCVLKGTLEMHTALIEPKGSCNVYFVKFPF